jgi:hypothetical protein
MTQKPKAVNEPKAVNDAEAKVVNDADAYESQRERDKAKRV